MALVKASSTVAVCESKLPKKAFKQKVLDEDSYLQAVGDIIERDFFPDLKRLGLENEYTAALESNDAERIRRIQLEVQRFEARQRSSIGATSLPSGRDQTGESSDAVRDGGQPTEDVRLDAFMANNTSEDNVSFENIMEDMKEKRREKYSWLYKMREQQNQREEDVLALEHGGVIDAEIPNALEYGTKVETWKYKPRNALMYVPEGTELSSNEIIEASAKDDRVICLENTRFQRNPFDNRSSEHALTTSSRDHAIMQKAVGKIGVDGRLEAPSSTPNVGGYNFVPEPSPAPGVDESPLMTWGSIEGTPLRVDATPGTPASSFKIPQPPKREEIGHRLAEEASKQHRSKRKAALAAATALSLKSRKSGRLATAERITSLTPAAQRLIKSNIRRSSDKSLQAAYSPSPRRLTSPRSTPGSSRRTTPQVIKSATPSSTRKAATPSLTDDLLNLP